MATKLKLSLVLGTLAIVVCTSSSVMAAELCSTNTSPCTGTTYGAETHITGQLKSGTSSTLTSSITNVTCTESRFRAAVLAVGPIRIPIVEFTTDKCHTTSGTPCTVTPVNIPWEGTGSGSGGSGTLTVESGGSGSPGDKVVCGFVINCTFTTSSATLSVTGGNPAIAKANEITVARSGGLCPAAASWDAEYEVTQPNPLFII